MSATEHETRRDTVREDLPRVVHLKHAHGERTACGAPRRPGHESCPGYRRPYFGEGHCPGCGLPVCPMCLFEWGMG